MSQSDQTFGEILAPLWAEVVQTRRAYVQSEDAANRDELYESVKSAKATVLQMMVTHNIKEIISPTGVILFRVDDNEFHEISPDYAHHVAHCQKPSQEASS